MAGKTVSNDGWTTSEVKKSFSAAGPEASAVGAAQADDCQEPHVEQCPNFEIWAHYIAWRLLTVKE